MYKIWEGPYLIHHTLLSSPPYVKNFPAYVKFIKVTMRNNDKIWTHLLYFTFFKIMYKIWEGPYLIHHTLLSSPPYVKNFPAYVKFIKVTMCNIQWIWHIIPTFAQKKLQFVIFFISSFLPLLSFLFEKNIFTSSLCWFVLFIVLCFKCTNLS